MTFLSREIEGKVRLPDDKENKQDENEKDVTLQQFAAEHRISERFEFALAGSEEVAGERASLRRVQAAAEPAGEEHCRPFPRHDFWNRVGR
ncbi:MAG: hypothetical protein WKF47_06155 [Geodermatophilaceae bacterium]